MNLAKACNLRYIIPSAGTIIGVRTLAGLRVLNSGSHNMVVNLWPEQSALFPQ